MHGGHAREHVAQAGHRVIARELRADPAKLDLVVTWIQRFLDDPDFSDQNKDALAEWMAVIREGLARAVEALADDGAVALRIGAFFPGLSLSFSETYGETGGRGVSIFRVEKEAFGAPFNDKFT